MFRRLLDMDYVLWILAFICVVCLYINYKTKKSGPKLRLPPRKPGVPIFRNLFNPIVKSCKDLVDDLSLGHVFEVNCFVFRLIFINSFEALQDALIRQSDVFSGRPKGLYFEELTKKAGVIGTDGPVWQEHRRYLLRLLRQQGFGKSFTTDIIEEELGAIVQHLIEIDGAGVDTEEIFSGLSSNVISRLLFGEATHPEDEVKLKEYLEHLKEGLMLTPKDFIPIIFPSLLKFPITRALLNRFTNRLQHIILSHQFIQEKIDKHKEILNSMEIPMVHGSASNLCDAILIERDIQERLNPGNHTFTDNQILMDLADMYIAGVETTATFMNWFMFLLAVNQEIQEKVHEEIIEVVGSSQFPKLSQRQDMPYACAVIDEALRFSSIGPFGLFHRSTQDAQLMGYDIPANSVFQINIYGIQHDPAVWKRPDEFYPEHFLSSDGKYQPSKYLLQFLIGKRSCLGESLARQEIFYTLVAILQKFYIRLTDPNADVGAIIEGSVGITHHTLPHQISFYKRSN